MAAKKKKSHVIIDGDLLTEIDHLIGKKKRSSFITNAAKKELKRVNQLLILKKHRGSWKDKDHPDMNGKEGTYKWVRNQREKVEKILRKKIG
jgi:hypothetical protein